jgi:signal transduction histidine kinase
MNSINRPKCQQQKSTPTTGDALTHDSQLSWCEDDPSLESIASKSAHQIWQTLSRTLVNSPTLKTMLLNLARLLGNAFDADGCLVSALRHDQTLDTPVGWRSQDEQFAHCHETWLGLLQNLAHGQEAQPKILSALDWVDRCPDFAAEAVSCSLCQDAIANKTFLTVKPVFKSRANGVIVLMRSPEHPWSKSDVQLLETLSSQLAIAISQTRLEQLMHQQIRYQDLNDRVTCAIRNSWDLAQVFELTAEGLVSALEISRVVVLTLKYADPARKQRLSEWVPKARAVMECVQVATDRVPLDHEPQATRPTASLKPSFWVSDCPILQPLFVEKAGPLAIANLHLVQDAALRSAIHLSQTASPPFLPDQFPALFLMPLENQGTLLGFLALQQDQPRSWAPEEAAFVQTIANHLSTAMIQARTIRHIQSLVDERTAQLQRSLEVQAKLFEKTRQQVEQLRKMNRRQEEFLSTVSHELLTPLTSMTVAIRMLKQAALSPDRRDKYLAILEQQCHQETSLINDLLTLQKLESGQVTFCFQPIDARYLIRDVAQSFESQWQEKRLTLRLDLPETPLNIRTDVESLSRILIELLTNAGKYTSPNTTVELGANQVFDQRQNELVLTLRNRGAGIAADELPTIFDRFVRGEGITQQAIPGTGLGLTLVKGLVEHLNGAIAVDSQPLTEAQTWETCFKVTLPQSPDLPLI